jgi:hypothetical protein
LIEDIISKNRHFKHFIVESNVKKHIRRKGSLKNGDRKNKTKEVRKVENR